MTVFLLIVRCFVRKSDVSIVPMGGLCYDFNGED